MTDDSRDSTKVIRAWIAQAATRVGIFMVSAPAFTASARLASAGLSLGIAPTYPASVAVGDSGVPASLEIWNASRFPEDTGDVTLSSIKHTPSCSGAAAPVCVGSNIDPGVFTLSSTGTGGSNAGCTDAHSPFACCTGLGSGTCEACKGLTFTLEVTDVTTGEVMFTPSATVNLGPSGSSADTCVIEFTIDVNELPLEDSSPDPGLQTTQLARATGFHSIAGMTASADGSASTTVLDVGTPTITPTLRPTPTATPMPKDSGFVPPDRHTLRCEDGVAKNIRKLKSCIESCQVKAAAAAFRERTFDEAACRKNKPIKSCRAKYDMRQAVLLARGICPSCLDAIHQATLANQVENDLAASNGALYCSGTIPLSP